MTFYQSASSSSPFQPMPANKHQNEALHHPPTDCTIAEDGLLSRAGLASTVHRKMKGQRMQQESLRTAQVPLDDAIFPLFMMYLSVVRSQRSEGGTGRKSTRKIEKPQRKRVRQGPPTSRNHERVITSQQYSPPPELSDHFSRCRASAAACECDLARLKLPIAMAFDLGHRSIVCLNR
ncbi:hypothetical protein BDV97DRAFT_367544 [Delphinella strobiligena]|nr:hypothetical protein BDV97DRAFT_367544 [Delphinella strobiligena]